MNHRRRGKRLALVTGSVLLALVAALAWNWERALDVVYALRTGYEFVWMPDGVIPFAKRPLNNSGQVAVDIREEWPRARAGSWSITGGEPRLLEILPGWEPLSNASAINDAGSIVGIANGWLGAPGDAVQCGVHAILWTQERGMVEIPGFVGSSIYPADIDDRNDVVGTAATREHMRSFIWDPSAGTREIGTLTETGDSYAVGINSRGWIAGNATTTDGSEHSVVWKPQSKISDLGCPRGYSKSFSLAINERNEILVNAEKSTPTGAKKTAEVSAPFRWSEETGYVALPVPSGYDDVTAVSLNNVGQVLLRVRSGDRVPTSFVVADGRLTQLPAARRGLATYYTCLNDKGWLAGWVETAEGGGPDLKARRGFVARPLHLGSGSR